mmetsp:Transcript_9039/g.12425  ORF Transcript_9039/g.12425 Transcript_9039/m.12425 type:complete len:89 (-) Transcript_9039:60-326(-)
MQLFNTFLEKQLLFFDRNTIIRTPALSVNDWPTGRVLSVSQDPQILSIQIQSKNTSYDLQQNNQIIHHFNPSSFEVSGSQINLNGFEN